MSEITLSKAIKEDAVSISKLQSSLLASKQKDTSKGFLVSGFTEEEYLYFIENYDHFYVAKIDQEICGVLMAYHSDKIDANNKTNMLLKHCIKTDFILVKQIFVSASSTSKGIATMLYKHLFAEEKRALPYVAVIVSDPPNIVSFNLHKNLNFSNFIEFEPDADIDNIVRPRSAWVKLPEKDAIKGHYLRLTTQNQAEDFGETMMSRSSELVQLYQHEDNLNWTKIGMQITVIFALFAAFIYLYEKELIPDSLPIVFILSFWGITINIVFFLKILSGLKYMMTYKEQIKSFDEKINFFFPSLNPIFNKNSKISNKSITVRLLPILSLLGLLSWVLVSLLLILKGLSIYSLNI